jgi:hypothetical protein
MDPAPALYLIRINGTFVRQCCPAFPALLP